MSELRPKLPQDVGHEEAYAYAHVTDRMLQTARTELCECTLGEDLNEIARRIYDSMVWIKFDELGGVRPGFGEYVLQKRKAESSHS